MQSTIHFCGGAGAVTGSNFLLESGDNRFLVDCGLSQGRHTAEEENWQPFSYDPAQIPFLFVTHAHIDHIGRIPKLVRDGFRGRIISTEATKALAHPLLLDARELLAHDARKHGREELYEEGDISKAMELWEGISYHQTVEVPGGFSVEFINSGHILGSAMVCVRREGKLMVFTGDLGGGNSPLLSPYESPQGADYLLMESVYGDRMHSGGESHTKELEEAIEDVAQRGGTLLIPAFSTERTQDVLFEIRALMLGKNIPSMPVYIDSPLAEKITAAYLRYPQYFSPEIRARVEGGENIFSIPEFHFVGSAEESARISEKPGPKIILAGSGMSNGGRVHSHEQVVLPQENSTVLIVGYQAAGSLGRRLVEGDKNVSIMGQKFPVRAKIKTIYGYSAHMDGEQLLEFVNKLSTGLKKVFVVMGEPSSEMFLAQRIRDFLGVRAIVPEAQSSEVIDL